MPGRDLVPDDLAHRRQSILGQSRTVDAAERQEQAKSDSAAGRFSSDSPIPS